MKEYRRKRNAARPNRFNRESRTFDSPHRVSQCPQTHASESAHCSLLSDDTGDERSTGFLTDEQYAMLLKELPSELKPLFAVGYATGIRLGELKAIGWEQVDLNEGLSPLITARRKTAKAG